MWNSSLINEETTPLNDKLKKEIDGIKQIILQTTIDFHNNEFRKYIQNYKKYLGFVHDRIKDIDTSWQSNVDYPLVASVVDTMFGNIFDFGYEFGVNEPMLKKLCSEAFDFRSVWRETFKEVTKEILITGKWYTKDYFLVEDEEHVFFNKKMKVKVKTPSLYYVSVFDVMYDRTKWLQKSPFKIMRTFSTGEAIESKILPLVLKSYPEDKQDAKKQQFRQLLKRYKDTLSTRFSMYDYNPVKMLTSVTQSLNAEASFTLPTCKEAKDLHAGYSNWTFDEKQHNYFLNGKQSTYELVEYITSDMKYIFINGNIIWYWPKKKHIWDIQEANFSIIPGTGNANGVADNLWNLQDINNMLWNAFLDNIKLVMGPMFKVTGNLPIGKNWTLDFKRFKAFKTAGQWDIEKIQLGVTDFAPINFMQIVQWFAEQRSWVNNYVMGGQWAIERVTDGVDLKFNQYKAKLTPITDSIDQMMGNIARSWIIQYFTFFTITELGEMGIKIEETKDEKWNFLSFKVNGIDIMTIVDERNITFTYNSLDKQTKENSRKAVVDTLPYLLQYASNKINLDTIAKILVWQDFDPSQIILNNGEAPIWANKWWRPSNTPQEQIPQDPNAQVDALLWSMPQEEWAPQEWVEKSPEEQVSEDQIIQDIMNIS